MKRRNPGLAGVAGITLGDIAALDAKRVTLQTIADKLGCSKQAVSKRIKTMRAASPAATSPPPASTGASAPAGAVAVDPAEIATSACLGLLVRSHAALVGPDALGPSALKALAATISTVTSELRLLGVMTAPEDAEMPTEFRVRILSDEEHDAIKRRVELPDED